MRIPLTDFLPLAIEAFVRTGVARNCHAITPTN
jgi:hypothetical protein